MARVWPVLKRVLRWGGILIGSVVLLTLILFAIAYAINWRDEPLSAETRALLQAPQNPYPPEDNVYLALAGFDAPPGESTLAVGRERVDYYERHLDRVLQNPLTVSPDTLTEEEPHALKFAGKFDFNQPPGSYWDDVPQHRARVEELLGQNRELYQRYLGLHRQRGYFETARPSPMAPVYFPPRDVRTLFLANAVLRLRSGRASVQQEALADLEDDVKLWRTVLVGDGSLISKMVAIAYLHWDGLVLADVIADPQAPLPVQAGDADLIAPLFALDDWDISKAYAIEFRVQVAVLQQTHDLYASGWSPGDASAGTVQRLLSRTVNRLSGHFFKFNATENLFAAHVARLTHAVAAGAMQDRAQNPYEPLVTLRTVYNPLGKILAAISQAAYEPYPARAWDGAAFQRLLRLSYEIRRQRVGVAAIPAFLTQHPQWSTHPADGRPFLWDDKTATIGVQTLGPAPAGRAFALHVWQAPLAAPGAPR